MQKEWEKAKKNLKKKLEKAQKEVIDQHVDQIRQYAWTTSDWKGKTQILWIDFKHLFD